MSLLDVAIVTSAIVLGACFLTPFFGSGKKAGALLEKLAGVFFVGLASYSAFALHAGPNDPFYSLGLGVLTCCLATSIFLRERKNGLLLMLPGAAWLSSSGASFLGAWVLGLILYVAALIYVPMLGLVSIFLRSRRAG